MQNKSLCLHNIYVCVLCKCIMSIEIHTHACIYLRKICYIYRLNIFTHNINYMNINVYIFSKYILYE